MQCRLYQWRWECEFIQWSKTCINLKINAVESLCLFQIWDCVKFMTILTLCCSAMFQLPNTPKFPYCLRGFFLQVIDRPQALRSGPSTKTELKQTSRSQKSKDYIFKHPAKILITTFLIYFFKYFNLIYKRQTHKLTIFP